MEPTQDQDITCADCSRTFKFTVRDQQFYADKGFKPPKRCKSCREEAKAAREARQLD